MRNSPSRKKSDFDCISLLLGLNAVHMLGDWKKIYLFWNKSWTFVHQTLNDVVDSCSPIFGVNNLSIWCHTIVLYLIKHATNECSKNYWFNERYWLSTNKTYSRRGICCHRLNICFAETFIKKSKLLLFCKKAKNVLNVCS